MRAPAGFGVGASIGSVVLAALVTACDARPAPVAEQPAVDETQPGRALQIGDPAPDFSLPGSDDRTYRLADYRGRQAVVLAWFAKAFTGG
jgi:hypothetical protein